MPGDSVGRSAALTTREANVVADEGTGGAYGEESERLSGGRREGDVANGGGSFEDETRGLGLSNVLCETRISPSAPALSSQVLPRTSSGHPDLR